MDWFFRLGQLSKIILIVSFTALFLWIVLTEAAEGSWEAGIAIGAIVLMLVAFQLLSRFWKNVLLPNLKRITIRLDPFLERWFVQPLVRQFEESNGISIPDPKQPLSKSNLAEVKIKKLRRAVEQYNRFLDAQQYVSIIALMLGFVFFGYIAGILSRWLSDWSILVLLLYSLLFLIYARALHLIRDRFTSLARVGWGLEAADFLLSKEDLAFASKQLDELRRLITEHRFELRTLEADLDRLLSVDDAMLFPTLNVIKAVIQKDSQEQREFQEQSAYAERRWDLWKDVILGILFLVIGLIIAQIPAANDLISGFLWVIGLAQ
jgi:hypothetical protein